MAQRYRLVLFAALLTLGASALSAAIPDRERAALIAIYNATDGANWTDKEGWNGATGSECQWSGVSCDDAQTTVVRLELAERGLKGAIPQAIGDLTNLNTLLLWHNELSGSIPDSMTSLAKLEYLDLANNKLTGAVSPNFGRLSNLIELTLADNPLGGSIPTELGSLTKLESLRLSATNLTGTIPTALGQLASLQVLDLNYNGLTGTVPPELGNLSKLTQLILSGNKLSGTIPSSLYGLTSLETLNLEDNQLTGSLAGDVSRLQNLQTLNLAMNQFSGDLPSQITSLVALRDLNLYGNAFTGTIPSDVDRLRNLESIALGKNQLTGTLPAAIGRLTKLQTLEGYQNSFTGSLPPLDALTNLQRIELSENRLSGSLPDLRGLVNLVTLDLADNRFTGPIPDMFGAMSQLDMVMLYGNSLTGSIPPSLTRATTLTNISLAGNQLSGPLPSDIGNLKNLGYLVLSYNQLSGPIPDSFWELTNLVELRMEEMALSGSLPSKIGGLTKVSTFLIGDNQFSGAIPPEIGSMTNVQYLSLGANRFTGSIPREIGKLTGLLQLDLRENALSGPMPAELMNLTALLNGGSRFDYNRLTTDDAALRAFLNQKQDNGDFESTQTVTPANVKVTATTDRNATVEWTPISYQGDDGGYQISAALTAGGSSVAMMTTASKEVSSAILRGLQPSTTYFITVAAVSFPHDTQRNLLVSDASAPVQATTGARVLAPAEVIVTAEPRGMVQIDGVPQSDDYFIVTNFGDVATSLTGYKGEADNFFTYSPQTFTLAAGASQTLTIQSVKMAAGTYWGWIGLTGDGAGDDLGVSVSLLSATRPAGTVIADPVTTRVEIAGVAGTNSVGTASFRNSGTAQLTGIASVDVPWIVPKTDPITIDPGATGSITFTIDRSRRPDENGALSGNLSLIYIAGSSPAGLSTALATTPLSGIGVSTVTVVDVAKPRVEAGTIPALAPREVAYFVPAVVALNGKFGSMVSDLAILNSFGSKPVSDLRLYFTPSTAAAQTTLANVAALSGNQSLTLANVVKNVYASSDALGSLQVRTNDWQKLVVSAKQLSVGNSGTYAGDAPVFRSDRSAAAGAQTFLTGLRQGNGFSSTIHLQETSGAAAAAHVDVLDASGVVVATRDVSLASFASASISDLVTSSSATAIVTTAAGSSGRISAYASIVDESTGESWSVVDWSRYHDFRQTDPVRIPFASSSGGSAPSRRRAVRMDSEKTPQAIETDATTARVSTQLTLFNPAATEGRTKLKYVTSAGSSQKDITLAARQTLSIADAASYAGAPSTAGNASMILDPGQGRIVASVRVSSGAAGSSIPVVSALSGMRLGQSQIFSGLEDSMSSTVAAAKPGTYRTTYGFLEIANAPVTLTVTVLLSDGRSLVTAVATRRFDIAAGQLVVVPDMVKSIIGSDRDTRYPDLHNLQLEVDITGGSGAIVPFVTITDNATGDSLLRIE